MSQLPAQPLLRVPLYPFRSSPSGLEFCVIEEEHPYAAGGDQRERSEREHLRRDLGLVSATSLSITDMIGIGPFITIPLFLSTMGGPQSVVAWVLGALLAFCDGLVWAELGSAMSEAGGSYFYLRQAFGPAGAGRWLSFLVVWQIMFSAPLSIASGSIGFANYLHFLLPGLASPIVTIGS